jgi:hypothetical protein
MLDSERMLASRDRLGCVYECSCGTIHVSVGPVDLKFTRESLLETYEMLGDAVRELKSVPAEGSSVRHVGIDSSQVLSN